jgi:hypothetical protein
MSDTLETRARAHGIAIFERHLITEAQPPISNEILAEIEARCAGPIPDGLKALWATCFGGTLDYSLSVKFGDQVEAFSFNEIFYPDSGHYHDLWGWIDHEAELAKAAASKNGAAWSGRLSHLPFGGFEFPCRLYVCVEQGPDYGAVFAWTQGLPPAWTLRLNRDAIARVADDVSSLFQLLDLERDPFNAGEDDFESGMEMAASITALRADNPTLADDLTALVLEAVLEWRGALENGEIGGNERLRKVALEHAASTGDTALMSRLLEQGCDINERLRGGGNMLDHTIAQGHVDAAQWLVEHGADVGNAIVNGASMAPPEMIGDLLRRGARATPLAAVAAARSDRMESARLIADALAITDPAGVKSVIDDLAKWAGGAEATAKRIEAREMASNRSPQQHRDEGQRMRDLRNHCQSLLPPPDPPKSDSLLRRWWNNRRGR